MRYRLPRRQVRRSHWLAARWLGRMAHVGHRAHPTRTIVFVRAVIFPSRLLHAQGRTQTSTDLQGRRCPCTSV